jgi:hypothetical protein
MESSNIARQVGLWILYILAQALLIRHLILFDGWAVCYLYAGFLLLLPYEVDRAWLLLIGFVTGFVTDIFYDTLGIHAAASVLMMFLRPYVILILTPRGGYDEETVISLDDMGWGWFLPYLFLLLLVHHTSLFLLEASNWALAPVAVMKGLFSTFLTAFLVLVFQFLFYKGNR